MNSLKRIVGIVNAERRAMVGPLQVFWANPLISLNFSIDRSDLKSLISLGFSKFAFPKPPIAIPTARKHTKNMYNTHILNHLFRIANSTNNHNKTSIKIINRMDWNIHSTPLNSNIGLGTNLSVVPATRASISLRSIRANSRSTFSPGTRSLRNLIRVPPLM